MITKKLLTSTRDNGHPPPTPPSPTVESILANLLASGLQVQWSQDMLHISPRDCISDEHRAAIIENKPAIMEFLLQRHEPTYQPPLPEPPIPATTRKKLQRQLNKALRHVGEAEELTWELERTSFQRCKQRVVLEQAGHLLSVAYSLLLSVEDDGIKPRKTRHCVDAD